MKKKDVPQHGGILSRWREISYAVDDNGRYAQAPSIGWEPANTANRQAWKLIAKHTADVARRVRAGELSPLAYYMAKNQMDTNLLAKYVRLPRWRVKRHLRPDVFKRLKTSVIDRYADVFGIYRERFFDVQATQDLEFDNEK